MFPVLTFGRRAGRGYRGEATASGGDVYFPGTAEQIWTGSGQANQQWSWAS
ncbi:MAG: hypothetical protein QOJ73_6360 [Streptosporangiaceae bacterium]|jgi:hypothetical protein|nr:hypothetical protein [Streptosporangiaceae bacterium]